MQYRKSQKNLQGSNIIYIFAIQTKGEIERVKEIHKNLLPISPPNK